MLSRFLHLADNEGPGNGVRHDGSRVVAHAYPPAYIVLCGANAKRHSGTGIVTFVTQIR